MLFSSWHSLMSLWCRKPCAFFYLFMSWAKPRCTVTFSSSQVYICRCSQHFLWLLSHTCQKLTGVSVTCSFNGEKQCLGFLGLTLHTNVWNRCPNLKSYGFEGIDLLGVARPTTAQGLRKTVLLAGTNFTLVTYGSHDTQLSSWLEAEIPFEQLIFSVPSNRWAHLRHWHRANIFTSESTPAPNHGPLQGSCSFGLFSVRSHFPFSFLLIMLNVWRWRYCPVVWCVRSLFNPCFVSGHGDEWNPILQARTFRNISKPFNPPERVAALQAACAGKKSYYCWILRSTDKNPMCFG